MYVHLKLITKNSQGTDRRFRFNNSFQRGFYKNTKNLFRYSNTLKLNNK